MNKMKKVMGGLYEYRGYRIERHKTTETYWTIAPLDDPWNPCDRVDTRRCAVAMIDRYADGE